MLPQLMTVSASNIIIIIIFNALGCKDPEG